MDIQAYRHWCKEHINDMLKIYGYLPVTKLEYRCILMELKCIGFSHLIEELKKREAYCIEAYEAFLNNPNPCPEIPLSRWKTQHPLWWLMLRGKITLTRRNYLELSAYLDDHHLWSLKAQLDEQYRNIQEAPPMSRREKWEFEHQEELLKITGALPIYTYNEFYDIMLQVVSRRYTDLADELTRQYDTIVEGK